MFNCMICVASLGPPLTAHQKIATSINLLGTSATQKACPAICDTSTTPLPAARQTGETKRSCIETRGVSSQQTMLLPHQLAQLHRTFACCQDMPTSMIIRAGTPFCRGSQQHLPGKGNKQSESATYNAGGHWYRLAGCDELCSVHLFEYKITLFHNTRFKSPAQSSFPCTE